MEEIDLIAEQVALNDIMDDHQFVLYENMVIIKNELTDVDEN